MMLVLTTLESYISNLEEMSKEVSAVPEGLSQASKDKLEHLRLSGRDFFQVTPALEQAAIRYAKAAIQTALVGGKRLKKEQLWAAMAEGVGKQILLRFENGGNDASFIPLASSTLAQKSHKGQPATIGVATGKLESEMRAAKWHAE